MRRALVAVAVVVVTLMLWRLLGGVTLSDGATDLVVRAAGAIGIFGVEGVQDAYLAVLGIVSLMLAVAIVLGTKRLVESRERR